MTDKTGHLFQIRGKCYYLIQNESEKVKYKGGIIIVERKKSAGAVGKMLEDIEIPEQALEAVMERPLERSVDKWGLHSEAGQYISHTSMSFIKLPDGTEVAREGIISLEELAEMIRKRM